MRNSTKIRLNLTGVHMSPLDSKDLFKFAGSEGADIPENDIDIRDLRVKCIKEAEPIGSVPLPGTAKGIILTTVEKIKANPIEILIDKLGERIAFERTGVRIYEALLTKAYAYKINAAIITTLERFHKEEAEHMVLVEKALALLGGDITAQTPAADIAAVNSSGILKVLTDPRTTFTQCLDAILIAELTDTAAWELLVKICESQNENQFITQFVKAWGEEENHLFTIQKLLVNMTLNPT